MGATPTLYMVLTNTIHMPAQNPHFLGCAPERSKLVKGQVTVNIIESLTYANKVFDESES